jgi:hypothetical protein
LPAPAKLTVAKPVAAELVAPEPIPNGKPGRRQRIRYQLHKELRFSYREGNSVFFGSGRTRDLGEGGIRFESDHEVPRNSEIELRISLPVRLQDVCSLELVVRGRVLRSDRHGYVLRVGSCEFRTCGNLSFDQPSAGKRACSVLA